MSIDNYPHLKIKGVTVIVFDENKNVLLIKRRDVPIWTLPGGTPEPNETLEKTAIRESKEESGYDIEIVSSLDYIHVEDRPDRNYQVCLIPYLCKIVGGDGKFNDQEVVDLKFFDLDDFLNHDLILANDIIYKKILNKELAFYLNNSKIITENINKITIKNQDRIEVRSE